MTCGAVVQPWSGLRIPTLLPCLGSFVAGVIHPWRVTAFERLLWRACRGYLVASFVEMPEPMEDPASVRQHPGGGWHSCGGRDTRVTRTVLSPGREHHLGHLPHLLLGRADRAEDPQDLGLVSGHVSAHGEIYLVTSTLDPAARPGWGALTLSDMAMSLCPSFHCQVYPYPESEASRTDTITGLHGQIQDLTVVSWAS